jgi:ketosteroid isomerase-like protein
MSEESDRRFAEEWYAAWNAHDLDSILKHYAEDVVFASPFVVRVVGEPDGEMRGRAELRHYFARALSLYPDLRFEPIQTIHGVRSVILLYRSVGGLLAAEMMTFGRSGLIEEVRCHYVETSPILEILASR